ncbi:MAG: hypothetical protein K1W26_11635 [Acetatifactor sp.]
MPVKKYFLLLISVTILFTACGGGNVDHVYIPDWKPSAIYTDADIESAFGTVKEYFSKEFVGCTLTELYYPGDTYADRFQEYAAQHHADEAIILYSSFDVDHSGGDGSFNPDSTYTDWQWMLIRNKGGDWEHVDHGY